MEVGCAPPLGGGALQNLMGGLSQYMGEHGELKMMSKNTCEGVYLIVKLPAISLQACKSTKNELHTYSSRILARFYVIIYCVFSRNHFMEGCFMFQMGGGEFVFQMGGFIFKWGGGGAPREGKSCN